MLRLPAHWAWALPGKRTCWLTRRFTILAAYLLTSGSFRFHSSILTSFARAQLGNSWIIGDSEFAIGTAYLTREGQGRPSCIRVEALALSDASLCA